MPRPDSDGGFLLPGVIDPPRRCVQLQIPDDRNHIRAFWGALDELAHWYTWQRDTDKQGAAVAAVWRDVLSLARELFESDDPCPCEESMTDCCEPILDKLDEIIGLLSVGNKPDPIALLDFRQTITTIITTPGWEPTDLHPLAPDVTFTEGAGDVAGDLAYRQNALCHLLYLACVTMMRETRQNVLHAGLMIGIDAFLAGWWLPAGAIAIGSVIAGGLVTEALGDEQAVANVVCCMADELLGLAITQQNLIDAAQTCADGGNETLIAGGLQSLFADDETFAAFLHDLGQAFDKSKKGVELYCPCTEVEGVLCTVEGTATGIDLPASGGSGWTPDGLGGSCQNFGTILNGGGTFQGSSDFCLQTVSLQRFYGGTTSNEALYARVTVNGRAYYAEINPSVHCTVSITPNQLITSENGFRVDLLGGGERMCYTGVRFTGKAPA